MTALVWTLLAVPAFAAETGDVFVTLVDGNNGAIYLDGNDTGLKSPATLKNVNAGQHQIQVRGDCMVASATVDVAPGRIARTEMQMSSVGGFLMLSIAPETATVFLDGVKIGTGPSLGVEADCGDHVIEATADGLASQKRTIRVEMGSALTLEFNLQQAGFGTLSMMVEPVTAEIFLDGKPVAVGPVEVNDVVQGVHTIGAILDGYEPLEKRVTVKAGQVTRLDLVLTPADGGDPGTPSPEEDKKDKKDKKKAEQADAQVSSQGPSDPKAKKSGRGKKVVVGGLSLVAAGVGTGFVLTAYRNYVVHYLPGFEGCGDNFNCQQDWDDYHATGIRLYQYVGYGLLGAGALGLGTTGLMIVLTENGTPVIGLTGRW
jgi:hypothetical protein